MFKIRDLIQHDHTHSFPELPPAIEVEFEDGVCLNVRRFQLIYSNFFFMIHRQYPMLPVKSTHFIMTMLNGAELDKSSHAALITIILRDLHDIHPLTDPDVRERLMWMAGQITDNIDNIFTQMAEPYVAVADAMDIVQVVFHESIRAVIEETDRTETSLRAGDKKFQSVLMTHPDFDRNGLALAARTKSSRIGQILQCIGHRGYHTEVDGARLEEPTMGNYALGIRRPYDLLAGSLEASKSLYYADSQIQDTEYFGRRLQLLTLPVERIVYEDCGTQNYINWFVKGKQVDENDEVTYKGDLPYMVGKKYVDDNGNLKTIRGNEKHLIGTYLRLRSPLTCRTHNPHNVCHICFGDMALNVHKNANIGRLCAASMNQQSTQSLLSNKHLTASALGMKILLGHLAQMFFFTNKGKNKFIMKSHLRERTPVMVLPRDQAVGLTDIRQIENRDNINPMIISQVKGFTLILSEDNGGYAPWPVDVAQNNRYTIMTREFIDYLLQEDWETDDKGNFVFNLVNWDFNLPILELPDAEYNHADHASEIAKIIESNAANSGSRLPLPTLQQLFEHTNSKLNVNMVCLEVIIYACMIPEKGDFSMARNHPRPVMGSADQLHANRSASTAYVYEKQAEFIRNPASFFPMNRPDSPMDVAIAPKEVIEHYYPNLFAVP